MPMARSVAGESMLYCGPSVPDEPSFRQISQLNDLQPTTWSEPEMDTPEREFSKEPDGEF